MSGHNHARQALKPGYVVAVWCLNGVVLRVVASSECCFLITDVQKFAYGILE